MNLFDLMGSQLASATFQHKGLTPPGGHPQHSMSPMQPDAAPVGTQAALAHFGPAITQQLQAAYARWQQQQMQQAAADTMARTGGQLQNGIDASTQAAIDARMGAVTNPQPAFPIYGDTSGGDLYSQAPRGAY